MGKFIKLMSVIVITLSATTAILAKGVGDCVEVPSAPSSTGKLITKKTVLGYSLPDGVKPIRQMGIMPAMVVKQVGEYFLLANVPDDSQNEKACYMLGWVRATDVKAVPLHNCAMYSNICEGGG